MKAQRASSCKFYFFFILDVRWGWVVNDVPQPFYPGKEIRYPTYRRRGGSHLLFGEVLKILPPPGFDP
jgi:hypothetical protein